MNSIKYQHSELTGNHSGVRMKFWGVCCVGGKAYKQVVNYRFHLTMAVLDPKSYDKDGRDKTVTLSVIQHGQVFVLCVLKHGSIQQVSLNLIFDKGDNVTFIVDGYGTVHLTGYQLIDSSDSALDTDNEHYCPVAELGSEKQLHKGLKPSVNGVETKNKENGKAKSMKAILGDNEYDDDSDSDFSIKKEFVDSEEESYSESDEEEYEIEIDEDEVNDVLQDVGEMETPSKSEESLKRKLGNMHHSQKRLKKEKSEIKKEEEDDDDNDDEDDVIEHVEESKSDEEVVSDEGKMDSSIGNTPMPQQLDDSARSKKKSKKRKRLSEISNLGIKTEMTDDQSPSNNKSSTPKLKKEKDNPPTDEKTPKKKGENKIKHPVIKLEGGVEVQDVIVGRGPTAANGKIISVFYMGRLEDHKIFDSRLAPKKPFSFKLGVPEVIKGLDIGVKGMRVGGQRKLKIPPNMGYGSKGVTNVPPNSTLYFTVELQSVN